MFKTNATIVLTFKDGSITAYLMTHMTSDKECFKIYLKNIYQGSFAWSGIKHLDVI